MISAFIASATLALMLSIACLTLHSTNLQSCTNPIDRFFRLKICHPLQRFIGHSRCYALSNSLFAVIIMISDQQMITGIAILAASIGKLYNHSITVYHFNIVTDMAWLSSNTHLLCLCVMRTFLNTPSHQLGVLAKSRSHSTLPRMLRITAMVALACLLLYASNVAGYAMWNSKQDCPAKCVMLGPRGGVPLVQMIITHIFILQSYTVQIARVTPAIMNFLDNKVMPALSKADRAVIGEGRSTRRMIYFIFRQPFMAFFHFFTSDTEFMLEMVGWYALGLYWTFTDRSAGHKKMHQDEIWMENHLGFGQLVPLLLLLLAILAGMEGYIGRNGGNESRRVSNSETSSEKLSAKNIEFAHRLPEGFAYAH
jgi:hypothetical protein